MGHIPFIDSDVLCFTAVESDPHLVGVEISDLVRKNTLQTTTPATITTLNSNNDHRRTTEWIERCYVRIGLRTELSGVPDDRYW